MYQLAIIFCLTFVIHIIGTMAYAFRIAGVRTGRIAVSFALFNVFVLVSRTANSFQGPFLAKRVETAIMAPSQYDLSADFRWLLLAATAATLVGAILIPTFQRTFTHAVRDFQTHRSVVRLGMRALSARGIWLLTRSVSVPRYKNLAELRIGVGLPFGIVLMNFVATALWTVGVFAAIYAGYLDPDFRVTSSTLSSIVNGVATIMLFIFIDPFMSGLTDDVASGTGRESEFRRAVVWMVVSRVAGTLAAQALLVPSAHLIAYVSRHI
jgi:hypothetical protein